MATLPILTAEEFIALDSLERQVARRTARQGPLVQQVLRAFIDRSGPVTVQDIAAARPDEPGDSVRHALMALDEDDLIRLRDDHVDIAYPFSALPTAFVVRLPAGHERYACCATDALGVAPMIGRAVEVRSRCHHCGTSLEFSVAPSGAGPEARGVMLWIGKGDEACKAADSL
jgi:hypothetical protein